MNEKYSCHLPLKDWELDIIGNFNDYVNKIHHSAPGFDFIAITAGGDVYECHDRKIKIGDVYKNWFHPISINKPTCFTNSNICPSIKANYELYNYLNSFSDLKPLINS